MESLWGVLSGIPWWVYLVFAYGVWVGVLALGPRTVKAWTLVVMPGVFLVITLSSLLAVVGQEPVVGVAWAFAVVLGAAVGWFWLSPEPLGVERSQGTLRVPGSPLVLILFLLVFVTKFAYGYAVAVHPGMGPSMGLWVVVFGLSGVSTGVLGGRNAQLFLDFWQTTEARAE